MTEDCKITAAMKQNKNQRKIVKIWAGYKEKVKNPWNERHLTYLSVSLHDSC